MKPIKAAETAPDGAAIAPPSFLDSLKTIDVSSLDRLIAIRQEHARIAEYRAKADEKKEEVPEAVYVRVSQDYAKRTAALEQQSTPLRTQARAEYRKLKALLDALGVRHEQAQLQKDELQFRHTVGELSDADLATKLVEPQRVLDQCASDREELDTSKTRFVEALGSEEALEASEPVAAAAPPAPTPERRAPQPAGAPKEAAAAVPAMPPAPASAPPAPALEDPGATRLATPIPDLDQVTRIVGSSTAAAARRTTPSPAAPSSAPRPAPAAAEMADGATVMLATAALVIEDPAGAKEYPLTVLNGIGRADENRICLSNPGISRKHAVITAVAGGFMVKDLGSQNGTFVNGQRVTEKRLAEGDTIDIGSAKFVFRTPWPRAGAAAARGAAAAQSKR